ncbi:hypothetical protein CHUAL_004792 [Chamberlinius hualienensis]
MGSASTKFRKYLQNGDEYAAMQIFQSSPDLQKSLNPNLSYGDSYQHNTPLHFAAKHAMKHLLRTFLNDLGGNPNKKNILNETCLHSVCQLSQSKSLSTHERRYACVVTILQWKGATLPNGEVEKIDLSTTDNKNCTALHYAAASGLARCVEILVAHGSPLFLENSNNETPCDCAEKAGHDVIAVFLESKMVFSYSGLRAQDLQEAKDQLLVETSDMLHVPLFTAEALLRDNEWSRETLLENWIKDPVECCEKAGVHPPSSALQFSNCASGGDIVSPESVMLEYQQETLNSPVRLTIVPKETMCEICTRNIPADEEHIPMICDHQFCHNCWESYLNVKIQDGDAHNIMCPAYGCMRLVPVDVIEQLVTPEMVRRYLQFDIKAFVDSNPSIKWCPYPGCGRAVRLPESEIVTPSTPSFPGAGPPIAVSHAVDCGNGHFFCWECLEEAHAPCNCDKWIEWHKKVVEVKPEELSKAGVATEDAANCLWLISNSKPCPNCKSPIQKNEGCNHMKCSKCKFDFCWVCLEAWKKHNSATGGYFRCNRFDAVHRAEEKHGLLISAAELRNKQMQELNRFVHFYTRFKNHDNNHKLEEPLLKQVKEKMVTLATSLPKEGATSGELETKFIECAVRELLKARRVLCGSYVFGYYLEDNGYNRTIFEYMQNDLEESTAKLVQMVARSYIQTPKAKIIQAAALVKRKRQEFTMAVSKGLIPPETPPSMRRSRRRKFPGLMGLDPVEDEQLNQAIAESIKDLDPDNPWVKDSQGQHTNLAAIYDWPDYDSDEEADVNNALAASILGICSRKGCTKPKARNPRTGTMHDYCSLRCSKICRLSAEDNTEESGLSYTSDYQMDLLIALEMSRLQMIEDMERLAAKRNNFKSDSDSQWQTSNTDSFDQEVRTERDSESPLTTLENLGDQATSSDELRFPERIRSVDIDDDDTTCDQTIDSRNADNAWSVNEMGSSVPLVRLDDVNVVDSCDYASTSADLSVQYFMKRLGDEDMYCKNIHLNDRGDFKAEKELWRFCKSVAKSADNLGECNPDNKDSLSVPFCSCGLHQEDSKSVLSSASSSQVLWELQDSSSSSAILQPGPSIQHSRFNQLRKSPTDGNLCFNKKSRRGRMDTVSWDMSMSLDTLAKRSSSAKQKSHKSKSKKHRHSSHERETGHRRKWLDWQFF